MAVPLSSSVQYHICCAEREPQIWKFVWNLRVNIGWKGTAQHINGWWMLLRKLLPLCLMHLRKVKKHSNSNGCLLLAVQYHICCAVREPQIWKFVWNLRVNIGRNDTVQHINGWWMLSEGFPICLMHLRKVMKHSRSNGSLSLQYIITFVMPRGYPKSGNLCEIWLSTSVEMIRCNTYMACECCVKCESQHWSKWQDATHKVAVEYYQKASPIFLMHLMKVTKHSSSFGCLYLQYIITFVVLKGYPKSGNLCEFESQHRQKWYGATHKCWWMLSKASPIDLMYLMKVMKHSSSNGCLSLQYSITFVVLKGYPKSGKLCKTTSVKIIRWNIYLNGWWMLSEVSLICLMHPRKVMKHSSSNGCLSLQYIITFVVLKGYPKSGNLCEIWESTSAEMIRCNT